MDDDTYVSHRNAVMALIKRVPKKELLALGYIGCGGAWRRFAMFGSGTLDVRYQMIYGGFFLESQC